MIIFLSLSRGIDRVYSKKYNYITTRPCNTHIAEQRYRPRTLPTTNRIIIIIILTRVLSLQDATNPHRRLDDIIIIIIVFTVRAVRPDDRPCEPRLPFMRIILLLFFFLP